MAEDESTSPEDMGAATEAASTMSEVITNLIKELSRLGEASSEAYAKLREEAEKSIPSIDKVKKGMKSAAEQLQDDGASLADTMLGMAGINADTEKSFLGIASQMKWGGDAMKGFTARLKKGFAPLAIANMLLSKVAQSTLYFMHQMDSSLVSFNKSTGALKLYGSNIVSLEETMYQYGITAGDAAEAQTGLVRNVTNLRNMSDASQESLLKTTAVLQEMGVDSDTTGASFQFMTASMGMTNDAAERTTRQMFTLAQALGMPPQEMAASFQEAMPQLSAFGASASKVFMKMSEDARVANMSVSQMLRITEQFDKFDSAAASVGKLNAALGGPYLSTIRMVTTTDPTDRMRALSEAVNMAGKSFDTMDYYERKMIASAMGLSDVNELALVMKGRFDLVAGATEMSSDKIEDLAAQTKDFNTIMEEFAQIGRAFTINVLGPLIKGIKFLTDGIGHLAANPLVNLAGGLGVATAGIVALSLALGGPIGPIIAAIALAIAGLVFVFKGLYDLVGGTETFVKIWEGVQKRFQPVIDRLTKAFGELVGEGEEWTSWLKLSEPQIEAFIDFSVRLVAGLIGVAAWILEATNEAGGLKLILTNLAIAFWPLLAAMTAVGAVITFVIGVVTLLAWGLSEIFHSLYVGNSPPLLLVFALLAAAIYLVGDAFKYPIQMIGKLMDGLKSLASYLAGKALGFISGAISFVFGGGTTANIPSAEVSNDSFNRASDMESSSKTIADAVADGVAAALVGMFPEGGVKHMLEITAGVGMPQLFAYTTTMAETGGNDALSQARAFAPKPQTA